MTTKTTTTTLPKGLKGRVPDDIVAGRIKIIIYGDPGVGKSHPCCEFPSAYIMDTEGGAELPEYAARMKAAGAFYLGRRDGSQDIDTVCEQVRILATQPHDRKTLVIDSITHLYNIACSNAEAKVGNQFGRHKAEANPKFRRLLGFIDQVDMNVIVVAHPAKKYIGNESAGVEPETPPKWAHLFHVVMRIERQGNGRKAFVEKSRVLAFPECQMIPWSYAEFASRYGREHLEAEQKPVEPATAEQVSAIVGLVPKAKVTDEEIEKWLGQVNAQSWSDLPFDRADKLISHLTKRAEAQKE